MTRKTDLTGRRFSHLTVLGYADDYIGPKSGKHFSVCVCKCDCGAVKNIRACSLLSGLTVSCGCHSRNAARLRQLKHGYAHKDRLYSTWRGMRERCSNPRQKCWHRYGGRGISVCREWDDFAAFRSWALSHGWRQGLQIDRIDDAKGYSPANCQIVTCKENNDRRNSPRDAKGRYMAKPLLRAEGIDPWYGEDGV